MKTVTEEVATDTGQMRLVAIITVLITYPSFSM